MKLLPSCVVANPSVTETHALYTFFGFTVNVLNDYILPWIRILGLTRSTGMNIFDHSYTDIFGNTFYQGKKYAIWADILTYWLWYRFSSKRLLRPSLNGEER